MYEKEQYHVLSWGQCCAVYLMCVHKSSSKEEDNDRNSRTERIIFRPYPVIPSFVSVLTLSKQEVYRHIPSALLFSEKRRVRNWTNHCFIGVLLL